MSNSIKIGPKIESLAKVNISSNSIEIGQSAGLYPEGSNAVPLGHLILKPLAHFNFKSDEVPNLEPLTSPSNDQGKKSGNYVLNVSVLTSSNHTPDPNNAIECRTAGNNILIFINYNKDDDGITTGDYQNFRYRIVFKSEFTHAIKGKQILLVTVSGDPEEGDTTQVVVDDEDEI